MINRILTGHDHFNFWLHKMKIIDNGNWNVCGEEDTTEHTLLKCTKYNDVRSKYGFQNEVSLTTMLKNFNMTSIQQIVKFLEEIQKEV